MTKEMGDKDFIQLADRIWGYLTPPKRGWSKTPSVAERQIRNTMIRHAKKRNDKRMITLAKHGFADRIVDESVKDYVSNRETRIVTAKHRVYKVEGFFASKLGWMHRKMREVGIKRVGGRILRRG